MFRKNDRHNNIKRKFINKFLYLKFSILTAANNDRSAK